jgi:ABC-2 type transport system ATP-binding protein
VSVVLEDVVADPHVIEVANLRKQYQGVEAVRGINLRVPRGSIFGLLGRNGAGKTTTIKVLMGMVLPSGGEVRVLGLPAAEQQASVAIRQRTGFVSEEKSLYDYMPVAGMVRFTASFYPRWRRDLEEHYLRKFDLPADRMVKALSRGMRTKLALLLAFCRGAELLILDEPTSGLDPAMTEEVLQAIVGHVAREEMTVFFSSHQISEVDQIADRVAIVDRGRTAIAGSLDDLRERFRRVEMVFDGDAPNPTFRAPGVERVLRNGRVLTVTTSSGVDPVVSEGRAIGAVSVAITPLTLKEIFLETVED